MRRNRLVGLLLLAVVILGVGGYRLWHSGSLNARGAARRGLAPVELKGYCGGEKMGFIQDPDVVKILHDRYALTLDVTKAGSIEMVREPLGEADFLWPGSQIALEIFKAQNRTLVKEELILNSPIVFYSWDIVADALEQQGIVERIEGTYYVVKTDELVAAIQEERTWADLGVPQLYGKVSIVSTDPTKSNSGNQFAGLLANILNQGQVVNDTTIEALLPTIDAFFERLGFLHASSGDLFSQYLKQGVGAYPIIVGYENQIVEFGLENQHALAAIQAKTRILYPQPTVWSSHPLLALTPEGARLIEALMDPEIQALAWSKHGFRTGLPGVADDPGVLQVAGIPATIEMVMPMPSASVMDRIVDTLDQ